MTVRQKAIMILNVKGVSPKYKGYKFLVDAIVLAHEDVNCYDLVTKCLYPEVAKIHLVTDDAVERNIRTALRCSKIKMTNSEFIRAAVWCIEET